MKILLLDNYDSFTYNLYHYFSSLGCSVEVFRNDKISIKQIEKKNYKKIIISPGPGTPDQSGLCPKIVKYFAPKIPILGVCLGHQIIGQVFGSKIINSKKIMHGKLSKIKHNGMSIFKGIKNQFKATRYHSLIVEKKSIGKDLMITAETRDKVIMAIMHKKFNVHGVQFHPESIKTSFGLKILSNFLKYKN